MSLYCLYNNLLSKTLSCCEDDKEELFGWVRIVICWIIIRGSSESTAVTSAPFAKLTVSDHGILTASVTGNEMLVQYVNVEGKILYSTTIKK